MNDRDRGFWAGMEALLQTNKVILDRPKGTHHPRHHHMVYPLDYGYVEDTTASDGGGIDVWLGSLGTKTLTGILCTFDTIKRDTEIKLLIGCSLEDVQCIQDFHGQMVTLYVPNPEPS